MTKLTRRRTGISLSSVGNGKVVWPVTNRERSLWRKCTGTQGIVGEPLEGDYGRVYGVVKFVFTSLHFEASSTRLLITRRLLLCRRATTGMPGGKRNAAPRCPFSLRMFSVRSYVTDVPVSPFWTLRAIPPSDAWPLQLLLLFPPLLRKGNILRYTR